MYAGILHKGDGTNIYLKQRPRRVTTVLGDGKARRVDCRGCDGPVDETRLMAPVALASGRDGSLYVGDYNFIRKLASNREEVASILQLGCVASVLKVIISAGLRRTTVLPQCYHKSFKLYFINWLSLWVLISVTCRIDFSFLRYRYQFIICSSVYHSGPKIRGKDTGN